MMYFYFYSYLISTSAYVICRLGIADLLKNGPKSIDELADATGSRRDVLYRLMRALAGFHVFRQRGEVFSLTPLGEMLTSDKSDSLKFWGVHFGEDVLPALPEVLNQTKTGRPAFEEAHDMPMWQYLSADKERGRLFDKKMSLFTEEHSKAILRAFNFSRLGTIVDVGGGRGALLCDILKRHPDVQGVVYDRPEVTPETKSRIAAMGLADRCRAVSGSFLESVPGGGDTYLLKHVCHDWDDEHVLSILKNCRRAMQPGQRLLLIEGFVEHNLWGWDGYRRWCDVYQMICLIGKERTLDEFEGLLAEAGFEMKSLTPTRIVDVAVLETVAVPIPDGPPDEPIAASHTAALAATAS